MHKQLKLLGCIALCLTTAQADACLQRVKEWWVKPAKKGAPARTIIALPSAAQPFPPEITTLVLDYLKRTEKTIYIQWMQNKRIDHIGIIDSADNFHILADPTIAAPRPTATLVAALPQAKLVELCGQLKETYESDYSMNLMGILLKAKTKTIYVNDAIGRTTELLDVRQPSKQVFKLPGPEEIYLVEESQKSLFSCCRRRRNYALLQEEGKED